MERVGEYPSPAILLCSHKVVSDISANDGPKAGLRSDLFEPFPAVLLITYQRMSQWSYICMKSMIYQQSLPRNLCQILELTHEVDHQSMPLR